jgi:ABC-type enterobactin transport system permease subunit
VAAAFGSVLIGNYSVTLADVAAALSGTPESDVERIILHIRVPRTVTGKKMEVPVRRILMGTPVDKAVNRESMANPEALDFFSDLAEED